MTAGSRAFRLDETLIGPGVLDPPPTRHALFAITIALATLLHVATIGSGYLHNGTEGQIAGSAREEAQAKHWLSTWSALPISGLLTAVSFNTFGVNEAAARLPFALAIVATTALTFLIAERLGGYWQGFTGALIYSTLAGTFVLAREICPDTLLMLFGTAAIYCVLRGYQERNRRRWWLATAWLFVGLTVPTSGTAGLICFAIIAGMLAAIFREARMRFRDLLFSPGLIFVALALVWHVYTRENLWAEFRTASKLSVASLYALRAGSLFPWLLVILPGVLFAFRRIVRRSEFDFNEALPIVWLGVAMLLTVLAPTVGSSAVIWPAFAIVAARAWERTPDSLRIAGTSLVVLAGAVLLATTTWWLRNPALIVNYTFFSRNNIAASFIGSLAPAMWMTAGVLVILGGLAIYLLLRGRQEFALICLAIAMVPAGFAMLDTISRASSYFSLADLARFVNARADTGAELIYEGAPDDASSLRFYYQKNFLLANGPARDRSPNSLDTPAVLEKWGGARSVYLIINQERVPDWKSILTERFHIYHQVMTCGRHVLLSNQL